MKALNAKGIVHRDLKPQVSLKEPPSLPQLHYGNVIVSPLMCPLN